MPTLTINITAPHAARLATALGNKLGLPGDANLADAKNEIVQHLRGIVRSYETQVAAVAATDAVQDINPT